MHSFRRFGLPEIVGLAVVFATIGAVLGGAGTGDFSASGVLAALACGALPFGLLLLRKVDTRQE